MENNNSTSHEDAEPCYRCKCEDAKKGVREDTGRTAIVFFIPQEVTLDCKCSQVSALGCCPFKVGLSLDITDLFPHSLGHFLDS